MRFLFPNVLSEPPSTFKVGFADSYEEGKVDDTFKDQQRLGRPRKRRRGRDIIYALSTTCTHLGCTPNWLEARAEVQVPLPRQRLLHHAASTSKAPPRGRWSATPIRRRRRRPDRRRQEHASSSKSCGQWDDPDSFIQL